MVKKENPSTEPTPPKLARRRENRRSTFKLGRTIGEKREKLETANERMAARKKDKRKKATRVFVTILGFLVFVLIFVGLFFGLTNNSKEESTEQEIDLIPTVEIVDEGAVSGGKMTSRMLNYIARAEKDFRELGLNPIKAVFPSSSIREIDFYLEGYPGFIKMTIDRDSAISVEDAERMIRYLAERDITDFSYIDVRIDGKAYWK